MQDIEKSVENILTSLVRSDLLSKESLRDMLFRISNIKAVSHKIRFDPKLVETAVKEWVHSKNGVTQSTIMRRYGVKKTTFSRYLEKYRNREFI
jgi:hypothetical protein